MKLKTISPVLPLCALLVLVTGCASTGLEPLDLSVVNVNIADATLFETSMQVTIRVSNPNPEPLQMDGASFKLTLNDKKIGTGNFSESFSIPKLGSEVVDVEFHINNATALMKVQKILEAKTVTYGVQGTLYVKRSYGTKKVKIERGGTLDLDQFGGQGTGEELSEDFGSDLTGGLE